MSNSQQTSDGTTTARGMKGTDWKLWVQPKGEQKFLLAWGDEETIRNKLQAEMNRDIWITSADGTVIAGASPK